jgi:hypothetical protein
MKEQTAMQELIEKLKNDIKEVNEDDDCRDCFIEAIEYVLFVAEDLLEIEQEQIWDAHLAGENHDCDMEEGEIRDSRECGHYKYYQNTYQTDWEEKRNLVKERRKELLIEMMRGDEELGLYHNEAKDL